MKPVQLNRGDAIQIRYRGKLEDNLYGFLITDAAVMYGDLSPDGTFAYMAPKPLEIIGAQITKLCDGNTMKTVLELHRDGSREAYQPITTVQERSDAP